VIKKKVLIVGAGAIGRGHLPWVFPQSHYEFYFDDIRDGLIKKLYRRGKYTTWTTLGGHYTPLTVFVSRMVGDVDFVITAVGTRNFLTLADRFIRTTVPIICCENDSRVVPRMRDLTGNPNIFFAIPDVITSSTAPRSLLDIDPLSLVTGPGVLYLDESAHSYIGNHSLVHFLSPPDLHKQWMAKLYLHNTPHCITAYWGWAHGLTYVHECLLDHACRRLVEGVLLEMRQMVVAMYGVSDEFCAWYAEKEMQRFSDPLLFDPITRVAREPIRKLALSERLLGAAMLCLQCGVEPVWTVKGIVEALHYRNPRDPDHHIMQLIDTINRETFVQGVLHLRPEEHLYSYLMREWG
jgi:mannitol-1-phosphate/altronate dehydrogenase